MQHSVRDLWFTYWCVMLCWVVCLVGAAASLVTTEWLSVVVLGAAAWFVARVPGRWVATALKRHPDYR